MGQHLARLTCQLVAAYNINIMLFSLSIIGIVCDHEHTFHITTFQFGFGRTLTPLLPCLQVLPCHVACLCMKMGVLQFFTCMVPVNGQGMGMYYMVGVTCIPILPAFCCYGMGMVVWAGWNTLPCAFVACCFVCGVVLGGLVM